MTFAREQLRPLGTDDDRDERSGSEDGDEPVLFLDDLPDEIRELIESQLVEAKFLPAQELAGVRIPPPSALVPKLTMAARQLVVPDDEDEPEPAGAPFVDPRIGGLTPFDRKLSTEAAVDEQFPGTPRQGTGYGAPLIRRESLQPLQPLSQARALSSATPATAARPPVPARLTTPPTDPLTPPLAPATPAAANPATPAFAATPAAAAIPAAAATPATAAALATPATPAAAAASAAVTGEGATGPTGATAAPPGELATGVSGVTGGNSAAAASAAGAGVTGGHPGVGGAAGTEEAADGVRAERTAPVGPPQVLAADRRSTVEERQMLRVSLGWRYDTEAREIVVLLAERPGIRTAAAGDAEAMVTDLVALRAFLAGDHAATIDAQRTGRLGTEAGLLACATSGLRRVPSYRGVTFAVVRGGAARADAWYQPGRLLWEPAPIVAAARRGTAGPDDVELVLWSVTGRRCEDFAPAADAAPVVFSPSTRLGVLAVETAESGTKRVYLTEVRTRDLAPWQNGTAVAESRIVPRLRAAVRTKAAAGDPTPVQAVGIAPDGGPFPLPADIAQNTPTE